jgi:hypothetical protein
MASAKRTKLRAENKTPDRVINEAIVSPVKSRDASWETGQQCQLDEEVSLL